MEVAGCTGIVVLGRLVLGQAVVEAAGCTGVVVLTSGGVGGTCRAGVLTSGVILRCREVIGRFSVRGVCVPLSER